MSKILLHSNVNGRTRSIIIGLLVLIAITSSFAQRQKVMVMDIKAEIDPAMKWYVEVALKHAKDTKADIVIVDMDTYGGALTDAKEIVQAIMAFDKPVWVFINTDAASAGALISIACDSIYMAPGASIGAATVVTGNGEQAPDKYQSYMRGIMRSTAEENHRDPKIAEKMVDSNLVLDSISPAGQVITFSTSDAIKYGYCEAKVNSIDEILERNNVKDYELIRYEKGAVDSIVTFFLNPFVSGLLLLVFIGGLYFEMQTPGVGFPGIASLVALVLYLIPYYLTGLAENWEVLVLFVGLVLVALEIFIIPGFGITGISGIVLIIGSLMLIMLDNDFFDFGLVPDQKIFAALLVAVTAMLGGIILFFFASSRVMNTKFFQRIALTDTQSRNAGFTSSFLTEPMTGKKGIAHSVLRPSGKVLIDGKIYDAFTQGEYIEPGSEIEVIGDETTSLRVRRITGPIS
jgi:membrane-bound serine protease (ClpP class)